MLDSNYYTQIFNLASNTVRFKINVIIHYCGYISGAHKKCKVVITQVKVNLLGPFIHDVYLRSKTANNFNGIERALRSI